jgi:hypothetical protein
MLKGYPIDVGYMGYVNGRYMLFETEDAYYKYCEEKEFQNDLLMEQQEQM